MNRTHAKTLVRLVDDDGEVLSALTSFLEMADWNVRAYRSAEAYLADPGTEPGCLVLDVRMPGMTGIELQQEMKRRGIRTPIIFLSAHGDIELAVEAIGRGALTFLEKPPKPAKLLSAISEATELDILRTRREADLEASDALWATLTAAEAQVALMTAKGFSSAETAQALSVSENTVRSQRSAAYGKLGVQNAVELADFIHERASLAEALGRKAGGEP